MKIAEAARHSGLSIDTLRFYEKEGLISPARSSGQRIYSESDLDELDTIARLRRLGISIPEIRSLLDIDRSIGDLETLSPNQAEQIRDVQRIISEHSVRLQTQLEEMRATLRAFESMTSKLETLLESGGIRK